MGDRTAFRPVRGIALALLALALAVRVLVPAGWMPMQGQGFAITLCTGAGAVEAWVDADGELGKRPAAPDTERGRHCAFAGLGGPLLGDAPDAALAIPFAPEAAAAKPPALTAAIGRGLAAPPPPATGPPATV
ncbi:MAG: DUF2946 family protein [Sphingomonas sp.]